MLKSIPARRTPSAPSATRPLLAKTTWSSTAALTRLDAAPQKPATVTQRKSSHVVREPSLNCSNKTNNNHPPQHPRWRQQASSIPASQDHIQRPCSSIRSLSTLANVCTPTPLAAPSTPTTIMQPRLMAVSMPLLVLRAGNSRGSTTNTKNRASVISTSTISSNDPILILIFTFIITCFLICIFAPS
jgi:hypothetical protein